ncbi:MAG TPA: methyltransferase domain-containing protein [Gemmatimonadota bacterium]|nr:methyltransferase domain-containing protein [Gemmatimonadota bacterium]
MEELREHWSEAADRWRRNGAVVRELTAPVSRALIDRADPLAGERWLDVASGVGDPGALLRESLDPEGMVVLSDVEHKMAATASEALGGSAPAVTAAAEALPFRSAFDGITCRFGAMFFADPQRALAEIRSSLKPSGRAIFAVWGARERNPFFGQVADAVREVAPDAPVPEPDEPHPFRYAPAGKLAALLRSGGWAGVDEEALSFVMEGPVPYREFWDFMVSMSADFEKLVGELPAEDRAALRSDLECRIGPYFSAGTCRFPAEARLVVARRPAAG